MAYDFSGRITSQGGICTSLATLGVDISPEDAKRLETYVRNWNFYEGYHWEGISDTDKPQITENYCRAFVNKFVSFEFGKCFNIKLNPDIEEEILPFLNFVWDDNDKDTFSTVLGQTKSITGDAWVQVIYIPKTLEDGTPNPEFDDPFDEHENGRIRVLVVQPDMVFPEYNNLFDKDKLKRLKIMYPVPKYPNNPRSTQLVMYKQVWDKNVCTEYLGDEVIRVTTNKYGIIPFVHIKNFEIAGRNYGLSDLEDLIPLNSELNLKKSDVSEIIDYHSAPLTVVYGAKVGQLEKGANKVWGGLPKDGRVENLSLDSDMSSSNNYIGGIKQAMHEIGAVPEGALGKETSISNTSGVALQVQLMPLIERVRDKQKETRTGLAKVNKIILKIAVTEGIISIPSNIKPRDFYHNEIVFDDNLPKDRLVELQQLQLEMKLGVCDREEAMKRLGKTDIQKRLREIEEDMKEVPYIYGLQVDENGELTKGAGGTHKDSMSRPLNENKAGNDSEVNGGLENSPEKQKETNS